MVLRHLHSDLLPTTRLQESSVFLNRVKPISGCFSSVGRRRRRLLLRPAAGLKVATDKKPAICTADELHYVDVQNSDWQLALWRYLPSPQAPRRNHPLLLLSGIGINAIGYDLSPEYSFARYMASQGYDTWTLELRGSGLSTPKMDLGEANGRTKEFPTKDQANEMTFRSRQSQSFNLFDSSAHSSQLAQGKSFSVATQMRDFIKNLLYITEWAEGSNLPFFSGVQESMSWKLKDIQKQLDIFVNYNWDFENYLEEDVPAAMEYIKTESKPEDGKLLAIGHSMGGMLLYATISRCCFEGRDPGLASIATLAASLDYTSSRSVQKTRLPLIDSARALDVPMIPMESLVSAVYPFATTHSFAWLNTDISAPDMMPPELYEKLVFKAFSTITSDLLVQMATAFQERGLCNRNGTIFYKEHLARSNIPILALAADQDPTCPPEAVYETSKLIPKNLLTYKVFGEAGGPHFSHYDIVGAPLARDLVYPCIVEFLNLNDAG